MGVFTPSENTNILTTGTGPGTFDYEFRSSRDVIETNIAAATTVTGGDDIGFRVR